MSEPNIEEIKTIIKIPEDLNNFLQSDEKTKFTGTLELTEGLFPTNRSEFQKIRFNLFNREVARIPIIGFEKDKKVFCLITNELSQTHLELLTKLEDLGYKETDIDFTTSIELGGTGRYILSFKDEPENQKNKFLITFGRGSDVYDPQFTKEGVNRIEEIFDGEIRQI